MTLSAAYPTVLLVAAAPELADLWAEYLRLSGWQVEVAPDALSALTQLERLNPYAVVCGTAPGDLSGLDLLEIVRSDPQHAALTFVLLGEGSGNERGTNDHLLPADVSAAQLAQILRPRLGALSGLPITPPLSGNLETLGLSGVLEALAQGERSGALQLRLLFSESTLHLAAGQIVQASFGLSEGEEAALTLLRGAQWLLNLDYTFEAGASVVVPVITASTSSLLTRASEDWPEESVPELLTQLSKG